MQLTHIEQMKLDALDKYFHLMTQQLCGSLNTRNHLSKHI